MLKKFPLFLVSLTLALAGCSNPSDPTDANFKKVISEELNNSQKPNSINCVYVDMRGRDIQDYNQDTLLQALVNNNYITATKVAHIKDPMGLIVEPYPPGYDLELSEKGKQISRKKPIFKTSYLCFGTVKVTKIKNYTMEQYPDGEKAAKVIYDAVIEDLPAWLSSNLATAKPEGLGSYSFKKVDFTSPISDAKMELIQGEKAWLPDRGSDDDD